MNFTIKNNDSMIHYVHVYLHRMEQLMIGCNHDSIDSNFYSNEFKFKV
jgi:hypothetical protein